MLLFIRKIWSIGIFTESLQWFCLPSVQASRPIRGRQSYSVSTNHSGGKLAHQSCPSYLHSVNRQLFQKGFFLRYLVVRTAGAKRTFS